MRPYVLPIDGADALAEHGPLRELTSFLGYRANALLTMARREGLLPVVLQLVEVTLRSDGRLSSTLRFLVACEACRRSGCAYTATHLVHSAHRAGVEMHKLAALDAQESDGVFSDAERAALRIAALPLQDSSCSTGHAKCLSQALTFFHPDQVAEIVAAIATARWFSTWNGLIGTALEEEPASVIPDVPWLMRMSAPGSGAAAVPRTG